MNVYNKINTLYKRYVIDKDMSDTIPNKDWLKFNHKIIWEIFQIKLLII